MSKTDPIADYLTRVRNAARAKHKKVDVPASSIKKELTRILTEQNFFDGYTVVEDNKQGIIRISLKYHDGKIVLSGIRRVSSPGLRQYKAAEDLPRVQNGLGIAIISTSKGLMTNKQARKENVGGEIVCYVW